LLAGRLWVGNKGLGDPPMTTFRGTNSKEERTRRNWQKYEAASLKNKNLEPPFGMGGLREAQLTRAIKNTLRQPTIVLNSHFCQFIALFWKK